MISFDLFLQASQPSMNFKISEIGLIARWLDWSQSEDTQSEVWGKINSYPDQITHALPPPQKTNGWLLKSTDTFQCKIIPKCIVLIFFPKMAGSGNSFKMVSLIPYLKPPSNLVCRVLVPSHDLSWNFA